MKIMVRMVVWVVAAVGGEPLWIVRKTPLYICHGAGMTGKLVAQAARGNVSTRARLFGRQAGQSRRVLLDKTSRAVILESRLFNAIFGLSRTWKEYHEIFSHDPKRLPSG